MSDSDDDMSVTGSENGDEDVEMEDPDNDVVEGDEEGAGTDGDGDETVYEETETNNKWFQKEIWQLKKIPYWKEIEEQANKSWGDIKAGIAHSILLNDPYTGLLQWIIELEKYIERYGRRFPKEDHILLVKVLLTMVKPKQLFRDVKCAIHCLNALLCRRDFLLRGDVVIDWVPLFDLYVEVMYKNLEEDGLFLLPDGFKNELHTLIFYSRSFFSDDAPQQLLDKIRPYMCPWDECIVRAWRLLDLFMPMNFPNPLQETKGAGLWIHEAWHWYTIVENNSLIEGNILKMFARLSYEAPGYFDFTDYLDVICTKLVRSLHLGGVVGLCQTFSIDQGSLFFSYLLGTAAHAKALAHLNTLCKLVESYVHPSNHGDHSGPIIQMFQKFLHSVVLRIRRERAQKPNKPKTCNPIPDNMKLNQGMLDELVGMMLPCIKLLIFSKTNNNEVTSLLRNACALAPKTVLPAILEVVYPALETLTEPHRLLQALQALVYTSPSLVKDTTHRIHAITLLNSLLPGLDKNDFGKSMVTFQFVGIMVNLIPIVDCSEAIHLRNDLTEEEKELCSATANFENIIALFMDKLLGMLLDHGEASHSSAQHGGIHSKGKSNLEDSILHRGTISVFKGIFRNSSTELYKFAMERIYSFISENVFDSKVVCDAVGDMILVANKCYPELAFSRFFKLVLRKLKEHLTPEIYLEEKPDFTVMWWLSLASRVVKVPANILLEHWAEVQELLNMVMPFSKCNDATDRVCMVMENILESLCTAYVIDSCRKRRDFDKPLDEYLPIRHWAEPVDKNNWDPKWYIPTQEAIDKAEELFWAYFVPNCEALKKPEGMDKKEILVRLWRIRHMLSGAGYSIPLFEGPLINLMDCPTFHSDQHLVCKPKGTPELTLKGQSIRDMLLDVLSSLLDHIENNSEDDVKSISEIITLLNGVENFRGISRALYNQAVETYKVTKLILSDKISGNRANIEMVVEDYIYLQHKLRVSSLCGYLFREQNVRIIRMLIKLSTSFYSQVRIKAQQVVLNIIKEHPYSYKLFLEEIVAYLNPANDPTHEQIKGALHLLVEGRRHALVMRASFETQIITWCAIILTKHSEKPSIIHLLETAQNTIVDGYESYRVNWTIYPEMIPLAKQLLIQRTTSPVNPTKPMPAQPMLEENKDNIAKIREKWQTGYYNLAQKLLELSQTPGLHWRQVDMAQAMMSLLVRRDMPMKSAMLKSFLRLVIHDSIKTRKMATAVVASWLRINKPKAVKRDYLEFKGPKPKELCSPTKWPIQYGIRPDNRDMMYEEETLPKTDEEWDQFQFCGKQHWGFYCWPKTLKTYAPLEQQDAINRTEKDLSADEIMVLETLRDPDFIKKLKDYFTIEEKKGEDLFNAVNFSFFQGLCRVYNDIICPILEPLLEELIPSTREADHRMAAEIIGGLINGSKLWKHSRQRHMWNWLTPLLSRALENVKDDNMRNWGVCLATVCGSAEARMLKPLMDILFSLLIRPTDSAFVSNARLFLVQGALCQFEWRAMELWTRFMNHLKGLMIINYANLRERVAVCLVSAAYYDMPSVYVDPSTPEALRPSKTGEMVKSYGAHLGPCWDETRLCSISEEKVSEVKKQARLAMKGLISFANNMTLSSFVAITPEVINLLPLFCYYANDVGDEELQRSGLRFIRELLQGVYINEKNFVHVLTNAQQIIKSQECWWKAKVVLLGIIRSLIIANLYGFEKHKQEIGELLCETLSAPQIEVREAGGTAFSNLVLCGFFDITSTLVEGFIKMGASEDIIVRHGGVLGLSAIVLASPYTVPAYLPDILMKLCRFASQKNPIKSTVKRTLSEFKRTHLDSWREHESHFNEDQLSILRDLLISPNYYV